MIYLFFHFSEIYFHQTVLQQMIHLMMVIGKKKIHNCQLTDGFGFLKASIFGYHQLEVFSINILKTFAVT